MRPNIRPEARIQPLERIQFYLMDEVYDGNFNDYRTSFRAGFTCSRMFLKGAPLINLVNNPAAYVIIFVGTAATIFMAFPMSEVKNPQAFGVLFKSSN